MPNAKSITSSLFVSVALTLGAAPSQALNAANTNDHAAAERMLAAYFSGVSGKRNTPKSPSKPISLTALQKAVKVAAGGSTEKLRRELMSFIVERVNLHGVDFSLSADDEAALRQAGASDELLAVLQNKTRERARHLEEQDWQARAQSRQPEVLQAFLNQYPASRFADAARARLETLHWERIQDRRQSDDFTQFIAAYPNSENVTTAQARIETLAWQKAQAGGSDQDFADYLNAYPQGTFAASVQQRRAQLAWEVIKRSNHLDSFTAFVEQHSQGPLPSPLIDAARIRIDQLRWEATLNGGKQKDFEEYLRQYPQGHFAPAARERIDHLVNPDKYVKKNNDDEARGKPLHVSEEELREALIDEIKPKPLSNAPREKTVKVRIVLSDTAALKTVEFAGGSRSLSAAALMLVQQWKFRPVKRFDLPVNVEGILTLQFPASESSESEK